MIASAQDARRLRACLERLKAAHLAVIRLAFFEDLPYADIARIEAVPVGTVSCDPKGIGQHNCGVPNGWILWHRSDTYNHSGGHPCAFGGGGTPAGSALSDLWVR